MKGNQTMDRIEKLEMEVEGLRNVIKNMVKKLGMDFTEFDKMNEIPERKEEHVKKNFFIAERVEHLDDDRFGNFCKSYSYLPYKEERRYVDDEGRVHDETYFFTFDTFEDALKAWKKNPMFASLGLYIYDEKRRIALGRKTIKNLLSDLVIHRWISRPEI